MTILFKKDTKGKTRFMSVTANGSIIIQVSGVKDGKPVTAIKEAKAKNVGRSNETTPEEQAKQEVEAIIKDKLTHGYFLSEAELEDGADDVILPMLAKSFKDEEGKMDWSNAFVQPKLDGMRALIFVKGGNVRIMSRQGKPILTVPHIVKAIEELKLDDVILDGELYAH